MKALWKGNISFALVSIPVRVYGATHSKSVSFHMLHKKCSTPLNYERHCPTCNMSVRWQDVLHGYEYEKNRFVTVTDEDLEKLPVKSTKSIDILRFIPDGEIEPIYYSRAYYLEPVEGGERAYSLLREIMKTGRQAALAKIAFKEKEHVSAIRLYQDALVLHTLYYADEIVKPESLNIPTKISLDRKELALAGELLMHFKGGFDIAAYHDEFRGALLELIKSKVAGREIKVAPVKEARKVVSLMDALKKSLKAPKKEPAGSKKAQKATVTPIGQVAKKKSSARRG